jgi:hypothetical protein
VWYWDADEPGEAGNDEADLDERGRVLAGENHRMHASPFAWRDTVEQRSAMAGRAPVDSGRELHGGEVEQALEAQGQSLGEALA